MMIIGNVKRALAAVIVLAAVSSSCSPSIQENYNMQAVQDGDTVKAEQTAETEPFEGDYSFTYEEAVKYVKVPEDLSALHVQITKADPISSTDIEEEVEVYRNYLSTTEEITDRETSETGDIVSVSYVSKVDGKEFEKEQDMLANLGSEDIFDGLDDAVTGMKKGETKEFTSEFPADYYDKELAGKKIDFTVTLNAIMKEVVPEITDEFVMELELTDAEGKRITTTDGFRLLVKQYLERQRTQETVYNNRQSAVDALIDASSIIKDYPDEMVSAIAENAYGTANIYSVYIKRAITEKFITQILVQDYGLEPSNEELDVFIQETIGEGADEYIGSMTDDEKGLFRNELIKNKVADLVLSKAQTQTVSEKEAVF